MVYIRHRDRMVQESVFEDLQNTLIACRWMAGTTSRLVVSPYDMDTGFQIVTTTQEQVLRMVKNAPVNLVDYFPETTDSDDEAPEIGDPESGQTEPNTLAMDDGQAGEPALLELGSSLMEVPYRFTFAFYASSVGVAQALMNDLRDRYLGNLVNGDFIHLYDYNTDPEVPVLSMEVDGFQYLRSVEEEAALHEATMFYGQLTITDIVDDAAVGAPTIPPPPEPEPGLGDRVFSFQPEDVLGLGRIRVTTEDGGWINRPRLEPAISPAPGQLAVDPPLDEGGIEGLVFPLMRLSEFPEEGAVEYQLQHNLSVDPDLASLRFGVYYDYSSMPDGNPGEIRLFMGDLGWSSYGSIWGLSNFLYQYQGGPPAGDPAYMLVAVVYRETTAGFTVSWDGPAIEFQVQSQEVEPPVPMPTIRTVGGLTVGLTEEDVLWTDTGESTWAPSGTGTRGLVSVPDAVVGQHYVVPRPPGESGIGFQSVFKVTAATAPFTSYLGKILWVPGGTFSSEDLFAAAPSDPAEVPAFIDMYAGYGLTLEYVGMFLALSPDMPEFTLTPFSLP